MYELITNDFFASDMISRDLKNSKTFVEPVLDAQIVQIKSMEVSTTNFADCLADVTSNDKADALKALAGVLLSFAGMCSEVHF